MAAIDMDAIRRFEEEEAENCKPSIDSSETKEKKDCQFYFESVVFEVEGTLFKVPRAPFAAYSVIFIEPQTVDDELKGEPGCSDENPFRLQDVTQSQFRNFLIPWFPAPLYEAGKRVEELTKSECRDILMLATRWDVSHLRKLAIECLLKPSTATTPQEKVIWGKLYESKEMFWRGALETIRRPEEISEDDARAFGYDVAYRLTLLRERIARRREATSLFRLRCEFEDAFEQFLGGMYMDDWEWQIKREVGGNLDVDMLGANANARPAPLPPRSAHTAAEADSPLCPTTPQLASTKKKDNPEEGEESSRGSMKRMKRKSESTKTSPMGQRNLFNGVELV